ncbi:MAG: formate dehydrogenase accessory sulfurtransferase FdhD [Bacteroidia bacterium]
MHTSVQELNIQRYTQGQLTPVSDLIAVEEPLQILLQYGSKSARKERPLTITMRTPGQDFELAMGLLLSEGLIESPDEVMSMRYCEQVKDPAEQDNVLRVSMQPDWEGEIERMERNFYSSGSCGVCGKTAIETVFQSCERLAFGKAAIDPTILAKLADALGERQSLFRHTGGIHAAALFSMAGDLMLVREDIGRHNALDKLIGALSQAKEINKKDTILFLSGRVGFELVQKAIQASLPVIVALGAPTSLAVQLAERHQQTLIGFLKPERFNVYSGAERLIENDVRV